MCPCQTTHTRKLTSVCGDFPFYLLSWRRSVRVGSSEFPLPVTDECEVKWASPWGREHMAVVVRRLSLSLHWQDFIGLPSCGFARAVLSEWDTSTLTHGLFQSIYPCSRLSSNARHHVVYPGLQQTFHKIFYIMWKVFGLIKVLQVIFRLFISFC
jgi:hypothetical protein